MIQQMPLDSQEKFDDLVKESSSTPFFIFKKSPICPVSFFAEAQIKKFSQEKTTAFNIYIVDVIGSRSLSQYIAKSTSIKHESPQALFIKNKTCIWNESHESLTFSNLEAFIKAII